MKIRVSTLTPEGLTINDTIPLTPLNERMDEGSNNDIYFLNDPEVNIRIWSSARGAETEGTVRARYRQPCGRCLKEIEQLLEVPVNYIVKAASPEQKVKDLDALGILYYQGEHIDLEEILQESLILALNPYASPPINDEGNCSICELNPENHLQIKNTSKNTLGDLLKNIHLKN